MVSASIISLISAIMSLFAIFIAFFIFKKVYQEDYKKPWLYIGISAIFVGLSQLIRFLAGFYQLYIISFTVTEGISFVLDFLAITLMAYGLVLEYFILEYYKGKFVKMKLIPVQEGSLGGEIDLDVSKGNSYFVFKKERKFILGEFSDATKKGYEGFLIGEESPKSSRVKYNLEKTPILWLNQIQDSNTPYNKAMLDENSEVVDPLHLNNVISFVDNFLEQAQNPFIVIELNLIFRDNSPSIVFEFLKYIVNRVKKYNGIMLCLLNEDVLNKEGISDLKEMMLELE